MKKQNNFTKKKIRRFIYLINKKTIEYVLRKIEFTSSCVIGGFFELAARK